MDGLVTIERIDGLAVIEPPQRQGGLVLTIRAGHDLVLTLPSGEQAVIRFQGKHGNGARLLVRAPRSVTIQTPQKD